MEDKILTLIDLIGSKVTIVNGLLTDVGNAVNNDRDIDFAFYGDICANELLDCKIRLNDMQTEVRQTNGK